MKVRTAICAVIVVLSLPQCAGASVDRQIRIKPNGYFGFQDGTVFVPLGGFYANWPGKDNGKGQEVLPPRDLMPASTQPYVYPFSDEVKSDLRNWFGYLQRQGITSLRLMLRGMDVVGRVNKERIKPTLEYMDMARKYGIRFQIVLFDDFDKPPYCNKDALEKVALPQYTQEELNKLPAYRRRFLVDKRLTHDKFNDPEVLRCAQDYLNELLPILMKRPEIYAYELENEQDPRSTEWIKKIVAHIRSIDPVTPIIGNPVELNARTFYEWSRTGLDVLNLHPYNHGDSKNASNVYNATRAKQALALLPAYNGESAMNRTAKAKVPEWEAAQNVRDNIWPTIAAGAMGCLMWVPEYRAEVQEFAFASRILKEFDLADFKRDRPDIRVFQSTLKQDDLGDAMRWTGFAMRTGYDFDFVVAPRCSENLKSSVVQAESIPTPRVFKDAWRPFEVSSGYFVQPLTGNGHTKGLVYLANIAGGIKQGTDKQWLRVQSPVDLTLRRRLGDGQYRISVYDLDAREKSVVYGSGDRLLKLGRTSHDYIITFVKR